MFLLITIRGRVLPPPPPHIQDPEQIDNSNEVTFQFQVNIQPAFKCWRSGSGVKTGLFHKGC